jgi:hypothetical protein
MEDALSDWIPASGATEGNDVLLGTEFGDYIDGRGGDDRLLGRSGNDTLDGGWGNDVLNGGVGFDSYYAGDGDTIVDSDGYGKVYVGSILLTGGVWDKDAGCYFNADKTIRYNKGGGGVIAITEEGTVLIKAPSPSGGSGLPDMGIPLIDPDEIKGKTAQQFNLAQSFPYAVDPLTLDLNGDGINTVPLKRPPLLFDISATGIKTSTGWIAPDDGLLAFDRNGNGLIDSGPELFGDATPAYGSTPNGKTADGFAALAQEDSNHDGIVNAQDAHWADLKVWQDLNQDGISQSVELSMLDQQAIVSLNVGRTEHSQTLPNGNQIADLGTFVRIDGSTGNAGTPTGMADINLAADIFHRTFADTIPLTAAVKPLPDMQGSGLVRDLREAAINASSSAGANVATWRIAA